MAQLVKMLDYVSRYEHDLSRYTTQFIRLKRSQWERMKRQWDNGVDLASWQIAADEESPAKMPENGSPSQEEVGKKRFSSLSRFLPFRKEEQIVAYEDGTPEETDDLNFTPNIIQDPRSVQQLRKLYMDQLFHFQLKWASSTLTERSRIDSKFMRDKVLHDFLESLPDSYLLFYYPVLKIKKAPVELEVILMTPVECICMTILEAEEGSVLVGSGERFWTKKLGEQESKLLNPTIGLNRMGKIVSSLFVSAEVDFPIRKILLSRESYIDFPGVAHDIQIIDRRDYPKWLEKGKKMSTPMKSNQFKASQILLDLCQTTAASRLFETEEEHQETGQE
ncbi:NERD domain-containing protein [Sporosarcina gallistercoris]|uniref:NERD domain-containing protein n=1 Tax=Sporosarcina gallistercoris TaxID=2762245 RepID=A0ABR8PI96_9BACL|nr:NERD domain-containing protein [Sporosarcina gallistercoris]MBD7907892.1 NERD domain-containing protein [Sporosarcina gallistercoris]